MGGKARTTNKKLRELLETLSLLEVIESAEAALASHALSLMSDIQKDSPKKDIFEALGMIESAGL
jgi:hypothetical protein